MLQVYDRVLATGGKATLLFVTLGLAVALLTFAALDAVRSRLLVRASAQIDASLAPEFLSQMLSNGSRPSVQSMRDLDVVRQTIASPSAAALFDLPWAPIFVIVCFLLHFWLGLLGFAAIVLLLVIARWHQQAIRETTEASSRTIASSHLAEQAAAAHAGTLRAMGMVGAMVDRRRSQRAGGVSNLVQAQLAGSHFTAISRFVRLFVQSAALGLGALLAIDGQISPGAVIAASILIGRALQPIDALIGGWSSLIASRA
jgi:ATP-binding cassette subfamily C protein|tara:strand:- start:163 stop:936 length:774 start_codon:yes stop_codon:yes gene_type:complete